MLKKTFKVLLSMALLTGAAMANDDQITGTITLNGTLAPKTISIGFALRNCGTDLTTCNNELSSVSFTGHVQDAVLDIGNIAENGTRTVYVQFEAKSKLVLFKNDYLQMIAGITDKSNDVTVTLEKLTFVSGGNPTFGQTTLGTTAQHLDANDDMIPEQSHTLSNSVITIWDQLTHAPQAANEKVFFASNTNQELTVRGVLAVTFNDLAESKNYHVEVTAGFVAKDN